MNKELLPQTAFIDNYRVVQSENRHVSIYDEQNRCVFHAQCHEVFDWFGLRRTLDFYLEMRYGHEWGRTDAD